MPVYMHKSLSPRGDTQPDVGTDQSEWTLSVTRSTGVQGRPTGPLEGATITGVGLGGMREAWASGCIPTGSDVFQYFNNWYSFPCANGKTISSAVAKNQVG